MEKKFVTLKHLLIEKKKCIGLQFYTDKVLQALINDLPQVSWSQEFNMYYVPNDAETLDLIYKQLCGVTFFFIPALSEADFTIIATLSAEYCRPPGPSKRYLLGRQCL